VLINIFSSTAEKIDNKLSQVSCSVALATLNHAPFISEVISCWKILILILCRENPQQVLTEPMSQQISTLDKMHE